MENGAVWGCSRIDIPVVAGRTFPSSCIIIVERDRGGDRPTRDEGPFELSTEKDITRLLAELNAGKEGAAETLLPLLYDELRSVARNLMRDERKGHTLQTTALVHEAYLRLCGTADSAWDDRSHYFRVAARAMRHVLIDHARQKKSAKRGGRRQREPLDMIDHLLGDNSVDLLALDLALTDLGELDPRLAEIVELRFFGGLTIDETARVLEISPRTVKSDWKMAKAWLKDELS